MKRRDMSRGMAVLVFAALPLVGGCEGVKQDLGIEAKRPPDEFTVYSRAPLSMPPDYALRPPASVTDASQAAGTREIARRAMLGNSVTSATPPVQAESPGLEALLQRTGATNANNDIRAQVNSESTILADADQSFVEQLMFWSNKEPKASVVDPAAEKRRIQENQALNRPITDGETPTITRKPKALLEGIF